MTNATREGQNDGLLPADELLLLCSVAKEKQLPSHQIYWHYSLSVVFAAVLKYEFIWRAKRPTAAKKKETTMSHMTSFVNAPKAWPKVSVLVKTAVVTARKAQAPVGRGSSTRPAHNRQVPCEK